MSSSARPPTSQGRLAEDGLAEDGLAEDGLAEGGLAEGGLAEDGLAEDGLAEDGLAAAPPARQGRVVCWLLNVPATRECISGTDLLRQFYALPH